MLSRLAYPRMCPQNPHPCCSRGPEPRGAGGVAGRLCAGRPAAAPSALWKLAWRLSTGPGLRHRCVALQHTAHCGCRWSCRAGWHPACCALASALIRPLACKTKMQLAAPCQLACKASEASCWHWRAFQKLPNRCQRMSSPSTCRCAGLVGLLLALAGAEVTLSDQPHIVPLADANAQVGGVSDLQVWPGGRLIPQAAACNVADRRKCAGKAWPRPNHALPLCTS